MNDLSLFVLNDARTTNLPTIAVLALVATCLALICDPRESAHNLCRALRAVMSSFMGICTATIDRHQSAQFRNNSMRTLRHVSYFFVGVLLAAVSIVAYASDDTYPAILSCGNNPGQWGGSGISGCYGSAQAACDVGKSEGATRNVANYRWGSYRQYTADCNTQAGNKVRTLIQNLDCPAGGTFVSTGTGTGECRNATPCAEGETRNPETGTCEPVQCEAGELNSAPGGTFLSTSSYCSGGCGRTADWYRMADGSTSAHIKGTGSACTPGPEPDPESCTETSPDFLGYVNEQPFCGPSGGNGDGDNTGGETGGGETGGGETGGGETGGGETGGGETGGGETGGGETGGGETGGGETGGGGTGGGGETGGGETGGGDTGGGSGGEDPEGEGACGVEGLPDCNVKINEEGTPDGQDFLDDHIRLLEDRFDIFEENITGDLRKETPESFRLAFSWNPVLPSGTCEPIRFLNYSIDVCKPLGMGRDLWSYAFVMLTMLYVWRRGVTAIGGSK